MTFPLFPHLMIIPASEMTDEREFREQQREHAHEPVYTGEAVGGPASGMQMSALALTMFVRSGPKDLYGARYDYDVDSGTWVYVERKTDEGQAAPRD